MVVGGGSISFFNTDCGRKEFSLLCVVAGAWMDKESGAPK